MSFSIGVRPMFAGVMRGIADDPPKRAALSLARFQPYHHRETRGNYKGDSARPHGNVDPMHRDLPAQDESQQLQYGNQRKENNCDDGERLLHVLAPLPRWERIVGHLTVLVLTMSSGAGLFVVIRRSPR